MTPLAAVAEVGVLRQKLTSMRRNKVDRVDDNWELLRCHQIVKVESHEAKTHEFVLKWYK